MSTTVYWKKIKTRKSWSNITHVTNFTEEQFFFNLQTLKNQIENDLKGTIYPLKFTPKSMTDEQKSNHEYSISLFIPLYLGQKRFFNYFLVLLQKIFVFPVSGNFLIPMQDTYLKYSEIIGQ